MQYEQKFSTQLKRASLIRAKLVKLQSLVENIALRSLQILYIFVLGTRRPITFKTNVVGFPVRNTNIYTSTKFTELYFSYLTTICQQTL